MIYKLLRAEEWAEIQAQACFKGSPVDQSDGFIHFSTPAQVRETAAKHYAGAADLVLAEVDSARLALALMWEPSRGGKFFPHLYAEILLIAINRTWPLPLGPDGRHVFPEDLPGL